MEAYIDCTIAPCKFTMDMRTAVNVIILLPVLSSIISICMQVELDFLVSVKSLSSRPWTHWWPNRYAGRHQHTKCALRDSSLICHCQLFPRRDQRRANIMILRIRSSLEEDPSQPLEKPGMWYMTRSPLLYWFAVSQPLKTTNFYCKWLQRCDPHFL
jgi:hypothetical protein